ncbi:hypothetical protein AB0A69_10390 [Streptomyces sp. NPDC045431]|uniref:hypothetical protein n=1 Tax=Streptomyces sp. NPDC045431 TaxID=3155613 RepID=UPI0033E82D32
MNRSIKLSVQGTILTAMLVLGTVHASAASALESAPAPRQPVISAAAAWTAPEGYTREDSFYGVAAKCQAVGQSGVADGKWSAYLCVQELPFTPFQALYVRK